MIFLYICGGENCSVFREHSVQISISIYRHNGYCIESTLFSEKEVLVNVLEKLSGKDKEAIDAFVTHYFTTIKAELMDIRSVKYNDMNAKFRSQKQEERSELAHVEFNDFLSCAFNNDSDNFQYVFNKHIIKDFIVSFDSHFMTNITNKTDDDTVEYYSSSIYYGYINNIAREEDFLVDSKELLNKLFEFADN